jgi:serine/arginine repetitive matrix protein 1
MSGLGGFRGVSAEQDARFSNKQKKALAAMKFPKELSLPVDYDRVNWAVMKDWIARRVTELLGIEEEVLIGTIHNYLIDQRVRLGG